MGLQRERTALNVDVSDDQKKQIYTKLVREQTALQRRISTDMERQHKMVSLKFMLLACNQKFSSYA